MHLSKEEEMTRLDKIRELLRTYEKGDDEQLRLDAQYLLSLVDRYREALELLVDDVEGYPAYERPCFALDRAREALKGPE